MTADTTVVVAALSDWHPAHETCFAALDEIHRLPAHATSESYSVLTRLPAGRAIAPAQVAEALTAWFPKPALTLSGAARRDLPARLAAAGISGSATYDALIALEASAHDETLLTLDHRAARTYTLLGVEFRLL